MLFENLMGLLVLMGSLLLMLLTVPWHEVKKLAVFGIVSGLALAVILIWIMQNRLGYWTYHRVDLLYLDRIPLLLSAAWTPTEIFFAHFLQQYKTVFLRILLIVFIPIISVAIHLILIRNHMLTYHHWNLFATFMVSLGIHLGLAFYWGLNRGLRPRKFEV